MKKTVSFILCAAVAVQSPTYAAAPTVRSDETVYVNLGYYGEVENLSVVKGADLNGVRDFKDYGEYSEVINMSNLSLPVVDEDGVSFSLPDDAAERFYYECKPKNAENIRLPWTFDISYKLNGTPVKAEDLLGASGLIETTIKYYANPNTTEYFKNNMLLQIASMVDMENVSSIEAEGAQLQSMGTYKAVVFMGLPSESGECVIRVGAENYESDGVVIMMIPGSLRQLEDIKELKEARDTVKDSADAINDSLNDILTVTQNMAEGLNGVRAGLDSVNKTRLYIDGEKSDIFSQTEQTLNDAQTAIETADKLDGHLENGKSLIDDISADADDILKSADKLNEDLKSYEKNIDAINKNLDDLQEALDNFDKKSARRKELFEEIDKNLKDFAYSVYTLQVDGDHLADGLSTLTAALAEASAVSDEIENIISSLIISGGNVGLISGMQSVAGDMRYVLDTVSELLVETSGITGRLQQLMFRVNTAAENGGEAIKSLNDLAQLTGNYLTEAEAHKETADDLIAQAQDIGEKLKTTRKRVSDILDDAHSLNDTANEYKEDAKTLLDDVTEIKNGFSAAAQNGAALGKRLREVSQNAMDMASEATEQTVNGLDKTLADAIDGLNKTGGIRKANNAVKDAIDGQLDKYDEENNLLNIDPTEKPTSFTSDKNPEPTSIQIVLRSREITEEDAEKRLDFEPTESKESVSERLKKLFAHIWLIVKEKLGM